MDVRSEEISQGVVLFYDLDGGGVGYLGVFNDLDTAFGDVKSECWIGMVRCRFGQVEMLLARKGYEVTHGFSPSSRTNNSYRGGAFMAYVSYSRVWVFVKCREMRGRPLFFLLRQARILR